MEEKFVSGELLKVSFRIIGYTQRGTVSKELNNNDDVLTLSRYPILSLMPKQNYLLHMFLVGSDNVQNI